MNIKNYFNNYLLQESNRHIIPGIVVALCTYYISPNNNRIRNVAIVSILHHGSHMVVNELIKQRNEEFKKIFFPHNIVITNE